MQAMKHTSHGTYSGFETLETHYQKYKAWVSVDTPAEHRGDSDYHHIDQSVEQHRGDSVDHHINQPVEQHRGDSVEHYHRQ